jgi:tRNA (mo5U34)-methyltransferase
MAMAVNQSSLRLRIDALGPWFHNINLAGIETAPDHFLGDYPSFKWTRFATALPEDLSGRTALDIGCNAGFYSIEMKRRGADRVVGIDFDERYLRQAQLAAEVKGVEIELRKMSVYEVAALKERFDIVLFMGVIYHLRHPLLALDLIRRHVARDVLVCQSLQRGSEQTSEMNPDYPFDEGEIFTDMGAPRLQFVEHRFAGDPTNWWIPNRACMEAMLRSCGFRIEARPEPDIYICRTAELPAFSEPPPTIVPTPETCLGV